jgi:hypothetical protein
MSEKEEKIKFKKTTPENDPLSVELNEHYHTAYVGQQLNQMNGQLGHLNANILKFAAIHRDLVKMNDNLYWISLSFKISVISGFLGLIVLLVFML